MNKRILVGIGVLADIWALIEVVRVADFEGALAFLWQFLLTAGVLAGAMLVGFVAVGVILLLLERFGTEEPRDWVVIGGSGVFGLIVYFGFYDPATFFEAEGILALIPEPVMKGAFAILGLMSVAAVAALLYGRVAQREGRASSEPL